jgi:citrate/tricarballylate utilization protein
MSAGCPVCGQQQKCRHELRIWCDTAVMGPLLALHLGVVFALFITLPYGKFVHGLYRYVALVRYARERRMMGHV